MSSSNGVLTDEQKKKFNEDGYLVLPGFASEEECRKLQKRMDELLEGFDPESVKSSVFSTEKQVKTSNDHFLKSGRKISFFFEEDAFDESGALKQAKQLSVNKVGHALHDLDPTFHSFTRSPALEAIYRSLGFHRPVPVQSMFIFKQPSIGGKVVPHQDSAFLFTDPPSCVGFWMALEEATQDNGCLWILPKSHEGGLDRRFIRDGKGGVTFTKPDAPFYDVSSFIPLPVKAGDAVLLHGAVVHYSEHNRSNVSRHAYSVHVIETDGPTYPTDNWLQVHEEEGDPPFEPLFDDSRHTASGIANSLSNLGDCVMSLIGFCNNL